MTSRDRDVGRKHDSGAEKSRKRKAREKLQASIEGSMFKYVKVSQDSVSTSQCNRSIEKENLPEESNQSFRHVNLGSIPRNHASPHKESNLNTDDASLPLLLQPTDSLALSTNVSFFNDPGTWPNYIDNSTRKNLVEKGPPSIPEKYDFPKDAEGRHFSHQYSRYTLANGEICHRSWFIYSKTKDLVYCQSCKGFNIKSSSNHTSMLCDVGSNKWKKMSEKLKKHGQSAEHVKSFSEYMELKKRLAVNCTLDRAIEEQINTERKHWKDVLIRKLAVVQYLGETNSAFRGSSAVLYDRDNGNFLKLIEMIAKFDVPMKEHLRRIVDGETHVHYLGPKIQNEVIALLGSTIKSKILDAIREAKYFSVILDCTPDKSHQEQITLIIRYVDISDKPLIMERFIQFLPVDNTTGEALTEVLEGAIEQNDLEIMDCRGQGYDNGANMKGRKKGVQSRVKTINKRATFTPCACHSLNLVLGDIAKCNRRAITFFGIIQRLYTLFSASTKRWNILLEIGLNLTLKPLAITRWECRIDSVKPVRYQLEKICEALDQVANSMNDPVVSSEAKSLIDGSYGICSFEFVLSLVIWHDLLHAFNVVSKVLQSENMQLDVAIAHIKGLEDFLLNYRETGFTSAMISAKEMMEEIGKEARFAERRRIKRKSFFDETRTSLGCTGVPETEKNETERQTEAEKNFKNEFFCSIVDETLTCIQSKFTEIKEFSNLFGFLFNPSDLKKIEEPQLQTYCSNLARYLRDGNSSDIDETDLLSEIELFKHVVPQGMKTAMGALEFLNVVKESYPNLTIAYRILLTIPVTVASGERSFSKLKLIETYLRTTSKQDRLNALATILIESEVLEGCDMENIMHEFATKKARKIAFA